ncbi:CRISP [Mactra antiquata]
MGCGSSSTVGGNKSEDKPKENTTKKTSEVKPTENTKRKSSDSAESIVKQALLTEKTKADTNDFLKEAVNSHNEYRSKHSAGPLVASEDLTKYSQNYADKLAKADKMEHSNCTLPDGGRVGENLYCFWSSDKTAMPSATDAVKSWYDEIKDYDFGKGGFAMNTGHFTQVVWKGSKELGMAWAKASSGTTYVVANYRPAGNMLGDFDSNVTES